MTGDAVNHASGTTAADDGGTLGPEQAAALLGQTTQQARRQLEPNPPWVLATRAVMVLAALGAIWLSVRGQHPYRGPTAADIPVLVAFVVVNFTLTVAVRQRAMAGVRGRTRLRPAEIAVAALGWVGAAVLMAALISAGVSYGYYPTTVLILPGLAWAGAMAARKDRGNCAAGLAVAVIGVAGLFAGPAGSWAVAGVGLCALLLGHAAAVVWRQRG
jgi:hypothetical protein